MTGAGGIGKQKPPVKEKCTSSLNVTLANYRGGGLPFAVCCSRPYIVYQTVKKLHFCLIDLQRDFFEEISNDDETHRLTGNRSWHSLRFVAKKRDEAGNVTHVLCTARCRAV